MAKGTATVLSTAVLLVLYITDVFGADDANPKCDDDESVQNETLPTPVGNPSSDYGGNPPHNQSPWYDSKLFDEDLPTSKRYQPTYDPSYFYGETSWHEYDPLHQPESSFPPHTGYSNPQTPSPLYDSQQTFGEMKDYDSSHIQDHINLGGSSGYERYTDPHSGAYHGSLGNMILSTNEGQTDDPMEYLTHPGQETGQYYEPQESDQTDQRYRTQVDPVPAIPTVSDFGVQRFPDWYQDSETVATGSSEQTYFEPNYSKLTEPSERQLGSGSANPGSSSSTAIVDNEDMDMLSIGDLNKQKRINTTIKEPEAIASTNSGSLGCKFNINDLPTNHGLIFVYKSKKHRQAKDSTLVLKYPTDEDFILMNHMDHILVYCNGKENYLKLNYIANAKELIVTCKHGKLLYKTYPVPYDDFECQWIPQPSMQEVDNSTLCGNNMIHLESFISAFKFHNIHLYDICVDLDTKRSAFTKVELSTNLRGQESFDLNLQYTTAMRTYAFKHRALEVLYNNLKAQRVNLLRQLDTYDKVDELTSNGQYYLVPARLVGVSDFVYRVERSSAFLYGNPQPMWNHLEKHNWRAVELAVSNFAAYRKSGNSVHVYAGTYKNFAYRQASGDLVEINLGKHSIYSEEALRNIERPLQTISKLFFKMVYDPIYHGCVAIVAHNTPLDVTDEDKECEDVTDQIEWLKILKKDKKFGVTYACACGPKEKGGFYPEFLPSLPVDMKNILKE